ncbi:MDR family MFS transporter [Listeria booriae]|uniref:MDR family MFS transporter n=1 Tax=Listeria booriae TaxID=1552123 RepID=UPI001625C905|nr:MFS transporter [Listeria booriae]MBC1272399.1 MFS transporter [Listeria booriae]
MFKELHPNIKARIAISFLSKLASSMIFPFMAIYFSKEINVGIAGILLMLNIAVQFVASIYGGHLADHIGRRKLMVWGEWTKVVGFAVMLLVNSPLFVSPWITFVALLLIAVSQGMTVPASDAMLIDVSTREVRAFMYSINYWANNLSITIGVVIGGWLFQSYLFEMLIALLVLSLITTWLTIALISETLDFRSIQATDTIGLKSLLRSYRKIMYDLRFLLFTLGGIAVLSIEFQRNNFISVRLADIFPPGLYSFFGFSDIAFDGIKLLSVLTLVNTLMIVLFTAPFAKWVRTRELQKWMYVGFGLFAIGFAICAVADSIWGLLGATVVLSVGELLYVPTRQTILADIVDERMRGTYMAFNGFVFQIGKLIGAGSLIFAPYIGKYGMGAFILLCGAVGIMLTAMALKPKTVSVKQEL